MIKFIQILLIVSFNLFGQKIVEYNVGENFLISYDINYTDLNSLSVKFNTDNPSLLLPKYVIVKNDTTILNRVDNYNYETSKIENLDLSGNVSIFISGEILAGNDSSCVADIIFRINNKFELKQKIKFLIKNGPPLPYVRFPIIRKIYPNPAINNESINIDFFIDVNSEISINLYDLTGKLIHTENIGLFQKGENIASFNLEYYLATGMYQIEFRTDNIIIFDKFIIAK